LPSPEVDKLNNLAAFRGSSFSAANNGGKCCKRGAAKGKVCWFDGTMVCCAVTGASREKEATQLSHVGGCRTEVSSVSFGWKADIRLLSNIGFES